jgi:hypothetical protein
MDAIPFPIKKNSVAQFIMSPSAGDNEKPTSMNLHPEPLYEPIPVKALITRSLGTRSQRINPWIPADEPAATICRTAAGYELKEAQIKPTCQSYRVLTGQEPKQHFGLVRLNPEKPCPTIQKSSPRSSTTGLIHPYLCAAAHKYGYVAAALMLCSRASLATNPGINLRAIT